MTCRVRYLPGGKIEIACSNVGKSFVRPPRCACGNQVALLCDFPTGQGLTCDVGFCHGCGKKVSEGVDYCPAHAKVGA